MAESSIFPAFIRAEYDGSSNGFSIFEKEAGESAARVARLFDQNFAEVQRVVSGATARGLKSNGAMDLGIDNFRQAAAQAKVYEASLRNTRDAANALAISTGDTSAETRSYLQALSAQVIEAQRSRDAAEAQVTTYTRLQSAIDATASRNSALAMSYREVYAEQARAAQDEVRARRAQEGYNAVFSPGLTRSAIDNGAGFAALDQLARENAEQARAADLASAALARQTAALEELRRAEAGAANGAAMLNAIMRETGVGNLSGKSASSSAAVFEQHFAEQARAAEQYAQAASRLRAELDPMFIAQQRFDREMDRADDLMKAGAISAREYAQAQQHARANLQAHSQAIHAQEGAFQQLARGSGVLRQAYIQTGQQGQDLVISLIGGQKASVVFAQQLPQLAFALSGLGMQADGTQKGIGRIATLLSGPWGIAFAGAAFAVGLVVEKLWQQDEASKAAEDAAKKHQQAIEALNEAMDRSIQTSEDKARADMEALHLQRQKTVEIRKEIAALLELAQADLDYRVSQTRGPGTARSDVSADGIGEAQKQLDEIQNRLKKAQQDVADAERRLRIGTANYQSEILDSMRTPEGRAKRRYEIAINSAKEDGATAAELEKLYRARDAEIAKIRETEQAARSATSARDKEAATVNQVSKLLIGAFGGTITSTTGGKHVDGSDHYKGRAVDFVPKGGMGAITKDMIRSVFAEAGVSIRRNKQGVEQLFGPGDKGHSDHFHVAWEGGKNEINSQRIADQLARKAEQQAAEAQRVAEELDRAARALFSRFDEGRAAVLDYGDAIAEINRVLKAGLISKDDAFAYELAASQQKAASDKARDDKAMADLDKALWGDRKKPGEQFTEQMEADMRRAAEHSREIARQMDIGLNAVAQMFGSKFARILDQLTIYGAPDSGLGSILSGIGSGQEGFFRDFSRDIGGVLEEAFGKDRLKVIGEGIGEVMGAAGVGATAGGLVLGAGNNKIGSAIGGALGKEAGDALGKMVGGTLGKALGPLGSIAGGIIGGAIGGLFTSKKWGTAVVNGNGETDVSVGGNKSAYRSNATLAGTSIQSGLSAIAEQLGVDVGGYMFSVGQYKGKWRVSSTGREGKLKGKYSDVTDFGKEGAEDAIKFAIADAVKDGALIGLRASTQALLSRSDDVEAQLQKALDFENVFARLKSYKDPVGAAMDTLDKEFSRLKKIFEEAGASSAEYAELEELYGIERAAAVKEAGEKVTASLKSLFDELTLTNDARSLRDRLVEAQAQYSPLAQRVAAGDTSAYDDYSDIARTMLDLQRQISGSGTDYFKLLDEVTALTKTRIDSETNIASIAAARESLFSTSESSMAPMVSATETQTERLAAVLNGNTLQVLTALNIQNENLVTLARTMAAQSGGSSDVRLTVNRNNF